MSLNLTNKGIELMLKSVIGAMGIDANALMLNLQQFQQWVVNAVKHHDARLNALEASNQENSAKLDRIIQILSENNDGRNDEQSANPGNELEFFDRDAA